MEKLSFKIFVLLFFSTLFVLVFPATAQAAVVTISADFDGYWHSVADCIDDTGSVPAGLGSGGELTRVYVRFPLTSLPSGATVTDVQLEVNVVTIWGGGVTANVQAYNLDGQADPAIDSCATRRTRTVNDASPYLSNITTLQSLGIKTLQLPAVANAEVENAKSAVNRFSIGFNENGTLISNHSWIEASELGGTKLIITYTVAPPLPPLVPPLPPASTITISADFDEYAGRLASGNILCAGDNDYIYAGVTNTGDILRSVIRFPLTSLPVGAQIVDVQLQLRVGTTGGGGAMVDIQAYNQNGQDDPTLFSDCDPWWPNVANDPSPYYNNAADLQTTGVKTLTLPVSANTDLENAKAAVDRFSIGINENGTGGVSIFSAIERISNPGTDEPKLIITYTVAPPPPPSTITISADFDGNWTNSTGGPQCFDSATAASVGRPGGVENRMYIRFPLSALPSGATVTNAELRLNAMSVWGSPPAGAVVDIQAYNQDGQVDPFSDSCITRGIRVMDDATPYLDNDTTLRSAGVQTMQLPSDSFTDIENAKATVNRFSIGINENSLLGSKSSTMEHIEHAGTDEAKLIITYTAAAASDIAPPSIPTNLSAIARSSAQINLSWAASTDNVGVTGYRIYRDGVEIDTTTSTSYSDTGLSPTTSYTYTVSAFDAAGNESAQSTPVSALTPSGPIRARIPVIGGGIGGIQIQNPLQATSLGDLVENIVSFIFWIVVALVPIMFLIGAFYFITSGGDPEKIRLGRNIVIYTLVGLIIVFFAKGVIGTIRLALGSP